MNDTYTKILTLSSEINRLIKASDEYNTFIDARSNILDNEDLVFMYDELVEAGNKISRGEENDFSIDTVPEEIETLITAQKNLNTLINSVLTSIKETI